MSASFLDNETWRYFWHPVCTLGELEASDRGRGQLLQTKLLGVELVVARLESGVVALNNRCPHRSAKLHLGWNRGDSVQCPYHGWKWGANGKCLGIPAAPEGPIPPNAKATAYDCEERYGLIWVRLDGSADTEMPGQIGFDDPSLRSVLGPSYVWKTHSARRVENYTDLAHFPFVHPETLGRGIEHTTFLTPEIHFRKEGRMRFRYDPPEGTRNEVDANGNLSPLAFTDYTIRLPFGVTLDIALQNGSRTVLWMWATPLDDIHCRSFWFTCHNADQDDPDLPLIDQRLINQMLAILEEDIDIVESQDPEQIPHPRDEIAVAPDKVSLTYRRLLYDLCKAKANGPQALNAYLNHERDNI